MVPFFPRYVFYGGKVILKLCLISYILEPLKNTVPKYMFPVRYLFGTSDGSERFQIDSNDQFPEPSGTFLLVKQKKCSRTPI